MMYKNTFKLVLSNFHLVWKILAYMVIAGLVLLGLSYACSLPILKVLIEHSAEEIDRTFDYLLNEQRNVKGCRVIIDFRNRVPH